MTLPIRLDTQKYKDGSELHYEKSQLAFTVKLTQPLGIREKHNN